MGLFIWLTDPASPRRYTVFSYAVEVLLFINLTYLMVVLKDWVWATAILALNAGIKVALWLRARRRRREWAAELADMERQMLELANERMGRLKVNGAAKHPPQG